MPQPSPPQLAMNLSGHLSLPDSGYNGTPSIHQFGQQFGQQRSPDHPLSDAALLDVALSLKKRERTTNWATEEKRMLLQLCRDDMTVIENKRLDSDLTSLKNRAWKHIHRRFSQTFGPERNVNRLKEQWRRMKAFTRSEVSDYHQRAANFGQQVADVKRPSPLTFEVWNFMLEAKRACRNEVMEGVDYGTMLLSWERRAQGAGAEPAEQAADDDMESG